MKGHGEKLTRKQEHAIAALLVEPTILAAAKVVGIGEATLWRWMQADDFQTAYRKAKQKVVGQAITQVQQAAGEAVETLRQVMNDSNSPPSSRVAAAKAVLETALKAVELEDLIARIENLERSVSGGR